MINLIRGEFYKLRRSKYFMGMMFLAIIIDHYPASLQYHKVSYHPRLLTILTESKFLSIT